TGHRPREGFRVLTRAPVESAENDRSHGSAPVRLGSTLTQAGHESISDRREHAAVATEERHEELAVALQAWGESGIGQICIKCRVVSSKRNLAAATGLSWQHF